MKTRISMKSIITAVDLETARALARTAWFDADAKMHRLYEFKDRLQRPSGHNARIRVWQRYVKNPTLLDQRISLAEKEVRKFRDLFDDEVDKIFNPNKELALLA